MLPTAITPDRTLGLRSGVMAVGSIYQAYQRPALKSHGRIGQRKEERWRIGASDWTLVRRAIRGSPQFESELEVTMQMITRRKAVRLLGAGAAGAWFAAAQTGLNLSFPPSASAKPRFHSSA